MRLTLIAKHSLTPDQQRHLAGRLHAPEHQNDRGPISIWDTYESYLYAFVHNELKLPIAISEASGRPVVTPGWWIDQKFRGQGYGNELVDLLAAYLVADGVTGIGSIPIDTYNGQYHDQSSKLARRFRTKFAEARGVQERERK